MVLCNTEQFHSLSSFDWAMLIKLVVGKMARKPQKGDALAELLPFGKMLKQAPLAIAAFMPATERKPPVTLRWITEGRRARSQPLLSKGTSGR